MLVLVVFVPRVHYIVYQSIKEMDPVPMKENNIPIGISAVMKPDLIYVSMVPVERNPISVLLSRVANTSANLTYAEMEFVQKTKKNVILGKKFLGNVEMVPVGVKMVYVERLVLTVMVVLRINRCLVLMVIALWMKLNVQVSPYVHPISPSVVTPTSVSPIVTFVRHQ